MFNRFELLLKSFPLWLFAVVLSLPVIPSVSHADEEEVDLLDIARRSRKTDMELYYSALVGSVDWDDKKTILKAAPPYSLPARDIDLPYGKLSLAGGIFVALNPEPVEPDKIPEGMEIPDPQSICGIYIGDGRFSFTPANDSERWSMNFQISQLSIVPNNRSPASAPARAPGTWSRIQRSRGPAK